MDPAKHLSQDNLDMLVVNAHALGFVYLLDLIHQIPLQFVFTTDIQNVVGI